MSLLNDMLKDLSQQQKSAEPGAAVTDIAADLSVQEQRELFNQSSSMKPMPRNILPSVGVFFIVLASLFGWQRWHSEHKLAPPSSREMVESASPSKTTSTATLLQSDQHNPPMPTGESIGQPSAEVAIEIAQGAAADSAAVVASADQELVARLAALETAVTTLTQAVSSAAGDSTAEPVSVEINANVDSMPVDAGQIENSASVSVKDPFDIEHDSAMIEAVGSPLDQDENGFLARELRVKQNPSAEPAHLTIAPNPRWQDEEKARDARDLINQGQVSSAIEQLQDFMVTADQPRESIKVLLDIFIEQGDLKKVNALMGRADLLSTSEQAYYQAKRAVLTGDDHQAIELLETHLTAATNDENYRALLAGLYQKNGQSVEAANHYRRLLSVFGDKPAYWLGYALAQDALDEPMIALQAYQRVSGYTDLQPQVRSYIQQRVAALQQ